MSQRAIGEVLYALPVPLACALESPVSAREGGAPPEVMRYLGSVGAIGDVELRATFNGGLGMTLVVPAEAAERTVALAEARGVPAWIVGRVVEAASIGGARYVEGGLAG